jgi:hypothetical protein
MAYKIKRKVPNYYIPLSDKLERQLDGKKKKELTVETTSAGY